MRRRRSRRLFLIGNHQDFAPEGSRREIRQSVREGFGGLRLG
jgi:hypothetical protein